MAIRPCRLCGRRLHVGRSSRPEPTCHPCRRLERVPYGRRDGTLAPSSLDCLGCGAAFKPTPRGSSWTRCCSKACDVQRRACAQRKLLGYVRDDNRTRRYSRELATPGLTRVQRDVLRRRWQRQGRRCFYCGTGPAETVDHVVPLLRGGTNYEGNLVPACRPCNSSKRERLLVEWRAVHATQLRRLRRPVHGAAA